MNDKNLITLTNVKMLYNELSINDQDDTYNDLKSKIETQNYIMTQYKQWITMLLSLVKQTEFSEYYDNILKGIERIEPILREKNEIKSLIIKEAMSNEIARKQINDLNDQINKQKMSLGKIENGNLIQEKNQLIECIDAILEDVDCFSEKNSIYKEFISPDQKKIKELKSQLDELKTENTIIKNKINTSSHQKIALDRNKIMFADDESSTTSCTNKLFDFSKLFCSASQGHNEEDSFTYKFR